MSAAAKTYVVQRVFLHLCRTRLTEKSPPLHVLFIIRAATLPDVSLDLGGQKCLENGKPTKDHELLLLKFET